MYSPPLPRLPAPRHGADSPHEPSINPTKLSRRAIPSPPTHGCTVSLALSRCFEWGDEYFKARLVKDMRISDSVEDLNAGVHEGDVENVDHLTRRLWSVQATPKP